ncbi:ATP-grasp domain-containing protein [Photobacterium lutimaris]|uniref:protein-tyrosine-phosphatase n=1 Tax=Photobacterium lutimaris TaxID=388278 RepID=A0A2T3J2P6_9GAMM|nr:ATP-grasp domain-containing protein [Photobacterium lutimaris]PSU35569.1 hypothetical protein C9I99_00675 [Photobacterium lutimaris]TDR78620.1 protein-tyrosine-phosphatase [Photobacterium lutimaris]
MKGKVQQKVLVIGEDTRSFLAVIRSLGKAGYEVHVICYDRTSAARGSKYIRTAKFYNYQSHTQGDWREAVVRLINRYQFDLVIPCDERALYPLWQEKHRLPTKTVLAIANEEALDILFDKWKTKQLAVSCGIPVAEGMKIDPDTVNYDQLADKFGDLFVIKPLQSFNQEALNRRHNVAIIHDASDYEGVRCSQSPVMVERYFSGVGEGVSVFSVDGDVKTVFSHRRDAEPGCGGGSSYRYSIAVDPQQLKAVEKICKQVRYTGVAMFEFRRDLQSNAWVLVEVNARFWGSLPLAVACGVDFPRYYADYLLMKSRPETLPKRYPVNYYARSLTADLYHIRSLSGTARGWSKIIGRFAQYGRIIIGREVIDSYSWSDIRPFCSEVIAIINQLTISLTKKAPVLLRFRSLFTRYRLKKLFKERPERRMIFICYGNIMRSPFAEEVLKNLLLDQSQKLVIESYGFHAPENRQSPKSARQAAQQLNYNLEQHRSRCLRQSDLHSSDIVFFFDELNKSTLISHYNVSNAFFINDLIPMNKIMSYEVTDPYGLDVEGVRQCYEQIELSVKQLINYSKGGLYGR